MTRSRLTMTVLAGGAGLLLVALLVQQLVLGPAADDRTKIGQIEQDIAQLEIKQRREAAAKRRLATYAGRTLGDDRLRVSEQLRVRLLDMLSHAGLNNTHLSLKPLAGRSVRGAYEEVGWTIDARGRMDQVTDLLFLMQSQPYLLNVDDISISPVSRSLDVTLRARCSTLVLDESVTRRAAVATFDDDANQLALNTDARRMYAAITQRDLLRPYIQRPPERPQPPPQQQSQPAYQPEPNHAAPPSPERFRLVGLPQWGDEIDILVRDSQSGQVQRYAIGDILAGGRIVMVDYRPMPLPENPQLLSYSRVIIKIGGDYWALDLGNSLNQRHRLEPASWPPALRDGGGET